MAALAGPLLLCAAWLLGGQALARRGLGSRGRLEGACLALALGLLAHVLLVNALARVLPFDWSVRAVAGVLLAGGLASWWREGRAPAPAGALEPEAGPAAYAALGLLLVACGLGSLLLGQLEILPDDGAHASMAQLMVAGQFPPRFACDPALRLAYHYGGDLLVASFTLAGGLSAWTAIDVARAVALLATLQLAFLAGWRVRRSLGAGLLSVLLLVTAGQMTWVTWPLVSGPLASWARSRPELAPSIADLARYAEATPYGLMAPSATPPYVQAQRSLAWGFGPFQLLLLLALLDSAATRRARTIGLGLALGATGLMQSGALLLAWPAVAAAGAWQWWRREAPADSDANGGFHVLSALALGLVLTVVQGGPVTDALLDRAAGHATPATHFSFAPLQLPSCRGEPFSAACAVLSVLNVGLAPFLLPWVAWRAWRARQAGRLALCAGCAVGCAFPLLVSYPYDDYTVLRTLGFSIWTLGALLGPLLAEGLARPGARRALAAAALLLLSLSGCGFLAGWARSVGYKGKSDLRLWKTPLRFGVGPHDEELSPLAARLPADARIFDPGGCYGGLSSRPAIVFGRYAQSAAQRVRVPGPSAAFVAVLAEPTAKVLRERGYTHAYVDGAWLRSLPPERCRRLLDGGNELMGEAGQGDDLRLLLRVCAAGESCAAGRADLCQPGPP